MDIDSDALGIPETTYDAEFRISSVEFRRVLNDMKDIGESVRLSVEKGKVCFSVEGEFAKAQVSEYI
jgi:proliferating cell nuclear antigen